MGSVVDVAMDVDSTKFLNDEAPAEALGLDKLEVILPKNKCGRKFKGLRSVEAVSRISNTEHDKTEWTGVRSAVKIQKKVSLSKADRQDKLKTSRILEK